MSLQLCGRDCDYKESHNWLHLMLINIVGACLSKFVGEIDDKKAKVCLMIWTFLTSHSSFVEGIHDERWMSNAGVHNSE